MPKFDGFDILIFDNSSGFEKVKCYRNIVFATAEGCIQQQRPYHAKYLLSFIDTPLGILVGYLSRTVYFNIIKL